MYTDLAAGISPTIDITFYTDLTPNRPAITDPGCLPSSFLLFAYQTPVAYSRRQEYASRRGDSARSGRGSPNVANNDVTS
jgi:hypothetical protein